MKTAVIVIAIVLLVVGAALIAGAAVSSGFDFSSIGSTGKLRDETYTADGEFSSVEIGTEVADVELRPSDDGRLRVECRELEDTRHEVTVADGTLRIEFRDERKPAKKLSFGTAKTSVTVYLPGDAYDSLNVSASTGDVCVPDGFSFGRAGITVTTGDISFRADVAGKLELTSTTGKIGVSGCVAGELSVSVTTGRTDVSGVVCDGAVTLRSTTGRTELASLTCASLTSEGTTGAVVLRDVKVSGSLSVTRGTGDVKFDRSDAAELTVKTGTGDVTGTLLTPKTFVTHTTTGSASVPGGSSGGRCEISTTTGDIRIAVDPGS